MSRAWKSLCFRYGLAVVCVVAATCLRWLIEFYHVEEVPFLTYFPAVFVTALYAGLGPTLLAVVLSDLAACYFFLPPNDSFLPNSISGWLALGLFTFFGVAVGAMSERLRRDAARARAERERFSVTLSSIGDGVVVTDAAGRVTYLNAVAEALTGWSDTEARGQPFDRVYRAVEEDSRQPLVGLLSQVTRSASQDSGAQHTLLVDRSGLERSIAGSAAPIHGTRGELLGVVLVFRDISDQRSAERRRNARLAVTQFFAQERSIDETIAEIMAAVCTALEWDVACFWHYNPAEDTLEEPQFWPQPGGGFEPFFAACRQLDPQGDYSLPNRARMLGEPLWLPDVSAESTFSRAADAQSVQLHGGFACPVVSGERLLGVVEFYSQEIRQPDDDLLEMMATMGGQLGQFIERREAETEMRRSESQFRTLAENIPQLAWMTDAAGWIYWYNRRWFEFTGTTLKEMQGWGWQKVHDPEHVGRVTKKFKQHIEDGQPWEDTFPLRRADGEYRWFLSRAFPIRDDHGRITRWFGTNTDITEQREVQEELRRLASELSEASRRKDEFLATLAHELRNPLAPICSGLELMRVKHEDERLMTEVRETMERQTDQLVALVDDLLDVSRITRGKLTLKRSEIELAEVVRTAVEAVQPLIEEANHELKVKLPTEPIKLSADPHRLAQIFSNLLNNASKFTPSGGKISLVVEPGERFVEVVVADRGIGIPPEMLSGVFDMFTQVEPILRRDHAGLGIGLTLVRTLVEMHGGSVTVASDGIDQGSEFRVRLPVLTGSESPASNEQPAQPESQATETFRVLVVDDNEAACNMLATIVELAGHQVRTATDGQQAIEVAAEFRPEIVLMDLGMPRMNGYEAARHIRSQPWGREMKLIALTGWGRDDDRRRTREAGFDSHLVKPAEPEQLRKVIAETASRTT